jgi:hypothetical protein
VEEGPGLAVAACSTERDAAADEGVGGLWLRVGLRGGKEHGETQGGEAVVGGSGRHAYITA